MFNSVELYLLAGRLYAENNQEVNNRTVINRAYYSAFLCARDYAKINSSSGSVHSEVINYFEKRKRIVFNQLRKLKDLRHQADYQLNNTVSMRDAQLSLQLAASILNQLNYLPLNTH